MYCGRLTEEDMDDIEEMIGEGRKRFTLLYSIARDACDPGIFHRRCDNKGPTVTMLYNAQKSLLGFYTSIDWQSDGSWKADRKNFLIQLRYLGHRRFTKCLTKGATGEILCSKTYGPYSRALGCFSGKTLVPENGEFSLNSEIGGFTATNYDTNGLSMSDTNNQCTQVIDLEVYSIADGERLWHRDIECPWRTQPQSVAENVLKMMEELLAIKPPIKPRLLLLGPMGAGKSSFVNTVATAVAGRMVRLANCGTGGHSATVKYSSYRLRSTTGSPLDIKLCDTPGLEMTQGIDTSELRFLLDGNVPKNYEFNPAQHISLKSQGFVFEPKVGNLVHCVAMVVDATTVEAMPGGVQDHYMYVDFVLLSRIPLTVLLTKVDKVNDDARQKLDDIFINPVVGKLVYRTADLFGVPPNVVFPIKNYEREVESGAPVNTLALVALKSMVVIAIDQMSKLYDVERVECKENKQVLFTESLTKHRKVKV
ncbi:IFI44-like protein [Mya arenaria]|uniref:IFI44-like protein n=1 Tax=Mya arenaria TaxID=6604 RepID=A0ABY7EAY3_MYAAR|nr:IFI44-like protein [Mya arenaria]